MEIGLREAVDAIRRELVGAAAQAGGEEIQFIVGPIELEFTIELSKSGTGSTGVKAWVLTGDVKAGLTHVRTHRVKVILNPKDGGHDFAVDARGAARPQPIPDGH